MAIRVVLQKYPLAHLFFVVLEGLPGTSDKVLTDALPEEKANIMKRKVEAALRAYPGEVPAPRKGPAPRTRFARIREA